MDCGLRLGAGPKLPWQMSRAPPPSPHLSRVDFGAGGKRRKGRLGGGRRADLEKRPIVKLPKSL